MDLPENIQNQLRRVLRLKAGDKVIVLNENGIEFEIQLTLDADGKYSGMILSKQANQAEPGTSITLYISLTQREKFEWILQKGTETGVSAFCPFISRRSLVQKADGSDKKRTRWESILREAAEQCGRGRVPILLPPLDLKTAIDEAAKEHDRCLAAVVDEKEVDLADALEGFPAGGKLALFIGPEGGFSDADVEMMHKFGVASFSLGPRVLRMETAAILVPALALYRLGK